MRENRGRQNTRYFEFEDANQIDRFVMLYFDLFVPYSKNSEIYIHCENETKLNEVRNGYLINNNSIKCNLEPEGLVEILKSEGFDKVKVRKGIYKYVIKRGA